MWNEEINLALLITKELEFYIYSLFFKKIKRVQHYPFPPSEIFAHTLPSAFCKVSPSHPLVAALKSSSVKF